MNYNRIYDELISKATKREYVKELYEIHHIVPRSWGGGDNVLNLVKLTLREHFMAHLLLLRTAASPQQRNSMLWALNIMINSQRYPSANSRVYEKIRTLWRENHPTSRDGVVDKIKKSLHDTRVKNGMVDKLCACGCGLVVGLTHPNTPQKARYLPSHPRIIQPRVWVDVECACGCGVVLTRDSRDVSKLCYKHGHNYKDKDYRAVSASLKDTLSKMSHPEMEKRMSPTRDCDHTKRIDSIRKSKSSLLRLTTPDGDVVEFYTYDDVRKITGKSYDSVRMAIRKHNGFLTNGNHVQYLIKYEGNNKWSKIAKN